MKKYLFLLFICLSFFTSVSALQLIPMKFTLSPSGEASNTVVTVKNDSSEPEAVQLYVTTRNPDINGEENNIEDEDNFLIYPPQLILPPNSQRTIRISWIGSPLLAEEVAYRLIAEQLPVDLEVQSKKEKDDKPALELKILFQYEAAFYVTPKSCSPHTTLESIEEIPTPDGSPAIAVVFDNTGTCHEYLIGLHLTLTSQNSQGKALKTITLAPKQLKTVAGFNVLGGHKRRFILPWPKNLPKGNLTASFELKEPEPETDIETTDKFTTEPQTIPETTDNFIPKPQNIVEKQQETITETKYDSEQKKQMTLETQKETVIEKQQNTDHPQLKPTPNITLKSNLLRKLMDNLKKQSKALPRGYNLKITETITANE